MTDIEAIPGGTVLESFQKLTERPVIKEKNKRQGKIASLSNSDGFKALQEVIDSWIEDLKNVPIDPQKDDVNSIGFRYLASRVTIEYLTDLRNMPQRYEDIAKAEEAGNEE